MAYKLGWLRNFIIDFKAGWEMHSAEKSISLNSGIFKCFTTLEKNEFNILAFSSSVVIILSSCTNVIFSEDFALSEKAVSQLSRSSYYLSHLFHLNFHNNIFKFFSKDSHRNLFLKRVRFLWVLATLLFMNGISFPRKYFFLCGVQICQEY